MQVCSFSIRLSGRLDHTIERPEGTVAEIMVLRALHGSDAVINIQKLRNDKREHADEFDRLQNLYGDSVVTACFPGHRPRLPVTLDDIDGSPEKRVKIAKNDDHGLESGTVIHQSGEIA